MYSYWCAYGSQSAHTIAMSVVEQPKKKRLPRESIKVGCQCHFIVRWLYLKPNDVVITYTACRHVDKHNVSCHGNDAVGKPKKFNYAPHLTEDIWVSVQDLIQKGFNVSMISDQVISDVKHRSGELFTGVSWDAFMTRQYILNIYNDTQKRELWRMKAIQRVWNVGSMSAPKDFFSTKNSMVFKTSLLS